jgi:diguanylate cyclase (GGDEF)-like protein
VRGSDAVFRYGGDEFLIILADTSCPDARHVVERIRNGLTEWNRAGHLEKFELSLSIGVAEWAEGKTLDDLLDGADHQMYAAKEGHKLSKGKAAGV